MKKILLISLAMLTLAVTACQKSDPKEQGDATYAVKTTGDTYFTVSQSGSKKISIYVGTANGNVDKNMLTATLKVDSTLVDKFNQGRDTACVMLPKAAYDFTDPEITVHKIYPNNTKSISADFNVKFETEMADTFYVLPITIESIVGSSTAKIDANAPLYLVFKKMKRDRGNGTAAFPYLIENKTDLLDMHTDCVPEDEAPDGCVYFKLMADIDLEMTKETTEDWEPLNWESPYKKKVNFNGNHHTIKNLVSMNGFTYASLFGVVYGEVYDLTIENAYIEGEYAIGVLGGYVGTTNIPANVHGVKIKNSEVVNTGGTKNGVGGLCGRVCESTIDGCSFDGKVTSVRDFAGGIFGYDAGTSIIKNCATSGLITTSKQKSGGIGGGLIKTDSKIQNCFTTMGIFSGNSNCGGIVGACNLDNNKSFQTPNNEISQCIAWNDSLSVRSLGENNWSCGAIVSFSAPTNNLYGCYRRNGLQLIINDPTAAAAFVLSNHDQAYNAGNPLPTDCPVDEQTNQFIDGKHHIAKYDGKEATAAQTASEIATTLGWDTNIWDLTGPTPKIK